MSSTTTTSPSLCRRPSICRRARSRCGSCTPTRRYPDPSHNGRARSTTSPNWWRPAGLSRLLVVGRLQRHVEQQGLPFDSRHGRDRRCGGQRARVRHDLVAETTDRSPHWSGSIMCSPGRAWRSRRSPRDMGPAVTTATRWQRWRSGASPRRNATHVTRHSARRCPTRCGAVRCRPVAPKRLSSGCAPVAELVGRPPKGPP